MLEPAQAAPSALATPEACVWLSSDGRVLEATEEAATLLCATREGLTRRTVRDFARGLDPDTWAACCAQARAHGAVRLHVTLACSGCAPMDAQPLLLRIVQDDAERFCLLFGAAAHDEAERRLREVIANIDGFVMAMGLDGRIAYAEGNLARYGLSASDLVGHVMADFIHPDDLARLRDARQRQLGGQGPPRVDFRFVAPTGAVHHFRVTSQRRLEDGRVTGFIGVFTDLSEQRDIEAQLQQAQKQDALGRVAGGVAHEFNNLFTVIALNTELAMTLATSGEPHVEELLEVQRAVQSARTLTQQLLAFGRRQVLRPAVVDVNELVGGLEGLLRRLVGEGVAVDFKPCPSTPLAYADPSQLEQLVVSLALNARDAMPRGGRLRLATERTTFREARAFSTGTAVEPGQYVLLTVADSGESLSEQSRERLFEPFFASRGVGTGAGIGLASVYGIAKQSGGAIEVTSAPGEGTTFRVYLPMPAQEQRGAPPARASAA